MNEFTIPVILVSAFLTIIAIAWYYDAKKYNKGKCANCDSKLENYDCDSQGGRGYKCLNGCPEGSFWISYPVDNNHRYILV